MLMLDYRLRTSLYARVVRLNRRCRLDHRSKADHVARVDVRHCPRDLTRLRVCCLDHDLGNATETSEIAWAVAYINTRNVVGFAPVVKTAPPVEPYDTSVQ